MSLTLDKFSVLSVGKVSPSSHRDWRIRWLNASQVLPSLSLHTVKARWRFNARITIGRSKRFLVCGSEVPLSLHNISKARKKTTYFSLCAVLLTITTSIVSSQLAKQRNNSWMWWEGSYYTNTWEAESGRWGVQGQPQQSDKLEVCPGYEILSPRKQNKYSKA